MRRVWLIEGGRMNSSQDVELRARVGELEKALAYALAVAEAGTTTRRCCRRSGASRLARVTTAVLVSGSLTTK